MLSIFFDCYSEKSWIDCVVHFSPAPGKTILQKVKSSKRSAEREVALKILQNVK